MFLELPSLMRGRFDERTEVILKSGGFSSTYVCRGKRLFLHEG